MSHVQPDTTTPKTKFSENLILLLTQTSTNAPTVDQIQNNFNLGTITPAYISQGVFTLTFSIGISNCTKCSTKLSNNFGATQGDSGGIEVLLTGSTITGIRIRTYDNGSPADGLLLNTELKITRYNL